MNLDYKQYLDEIKKKLDAMNKQAGIDPQKASNNNKDPEALDIFNALGSAGLKYMEQQKLKNTEDKK